MRLQQLEDGNRSLQGGGHLPESGDRWRLVHVSNHENKIFISNIIIFQRRSKAALTTSTVPSGGDAAPINV